MANDSNIVSVKIGGPAGTGVKSVGLMLDKIAARSGYQVCDNVEFPSLIRGGHNVVQVNFSLDEVTAPRLNSDLLIAFDQMTIDLHHNELKKGGGIIFDSDLADVSKVRKDISLYGIPLRKIANKAGEKEIFVNIVALSATLQILGGNLETFKKLIEEEYGDKGEKIVEADKKAADLGFEYAVRNYKNNLHKYMGPASSFSSPVSYMVLNGNEAAALGAISAGMQFAAIYPMSPINNILHVLAANQEKFGYILKQPEDEISAINMAIGASYAGVRSMTATSGGGFSLMTEAYGLAGITETPIVIFDGMRGGPATGLPTWSGQGDLQMALHSHQDEFPRIVLAPGDVAETYELTIEAFNLADKYQTPVVVLLDKNICENDKTLLFPDTAKVKIDRGKFVKKKIDDYLRYKYEDDGVSVRSIPGVGNFFIANSDEHNEEGYSTEEVEDRNKMMEKRMKKLLTCAENDMPNPEVFGPPDADITIVSWSSNKGSILEALKNFSNVNYVHVTWMNPFPVKFLTDVLSKTKHIVDIECNYTGQLANLIREKTGIEIEDRYLKFDGRIIYPEEIIEKLDSIKGVKKI
ncbi:MAG TPA: 2-oxoacid:acceptor oxidoreductase subunit alpha [bacterium]|nr:2-oxoacid:acceptor oxidoreductase subunit alpha [bacterium]HQG58349.1 2-oxoacid:acceptor oxidoreductase subunit alpha [bacterium]HQK41828.1 2-oxoacid:acceptor oxidoreductase subunit alpha [bacterium]